MQSLHWTIPPILEGAHVSLEPLQPHHGEDLLVAAADGELWNLWYTSVPRVAVGSAAAKAACHAPPAPPSATETMASVATLPRLKASKLPLPMLPRTPCSVSRPA